MPSMNHHLEDTKHSPFSLNASTLIDHVEWRPWNSSIDKLIEKPLNDSDPVKEAEMEWIADIDRKDFKLLVCGGWCDKFDNLFERVKASAVTIRPHYDALHYSWDHILETANAIQRLKTTGPHTAVGWQLATPSGGIKIRHQLYEVKNSPQPTPSPPPTPPTTTDTERSNSNGNANEAVDNKDNEKQKAEVDSGFDLGDLADPSNPYSPDQWIQACKDSSAKTAAANLIEKNTHDLQYIPAYTLRGRLISPRDYERQLAGACVRIKASIVHQYISRNKTDNYYADIREIVVLHPPKPMESKKRVQATQAEPSKRKKTT